MNRRATERTDSPANRESKKDKRGYEFLLGASAALTVMGATMTACRTPGSCLNCGLCAGLVPMAAVAGFVVFLGIRR